MSKKKIKEPSWKDVKAPLKELEISQVIVLVRDLYHLTKTNKLFLHARFSTGYNSIKHYKKIIEESLYPDVMDDNDNFDFDNAEQAIRDYSIAAGDPEGIADLMIYYVECGNKFTLDYGDINEIFYDRLVDMYERGIKQALKISKKKLSAYKKRLKEIMESSDGIGWGYHDDLCYYYYQSFQDD